MKVDLNNHQNNIILDDFEHEIADTSSNQHRFVEAFENSYYEPNEPEYSMKHAVKYTFMIAFVMILLISLVLITVS